VKNGSNSRSACSGGRGDAVVTHRAKLAELGLNLWWTWNPEVIELFRELDPALWRETHHNPIALLARFDEQRLTARIESESLDLPAAGGLTHG